MAWNQSGNIRGASGVPGASGTPGASGAPGTTTWSGITDKPAVIAAGVDAAAARNVISAEYTGNKNQPSGYCGLDSSGLVPSSNLPSFVDDVIEAANLAAFPATGESGKIYTALDTNKVYRWGGSSYTEISPSPGSTDAVPEGSTNLYYTAARADGRITAAVGSTVQAYSATLTTYAGKSAPTGAVVGTTDTQTLTNKDLTASSNTFPAFIKRSISSVTSNTTLGAASGTDYVCFANIAPTTTTPANFSSVVAQLHMDGTNNSTTIVDSSNLAANWTCSGNAKLATGTKKFGTASLSFSGTNGDRITPTAAASNYGFGTGAWTIEFFLYLNSVSGNQNVYIGGGAGSTDPALFMAGASMTYYSGGGTVVLASANLSTGTWYHIAACRSGSTTRMFIDGTAVNAGVTDNINYASNTPTIGFSGASMNGFVDEVRIYKGYAAYTSNFTAPTAAFDDVISTPGTVTLPTAGSGNTNQYTIKNTSGSSNLTIATTSSQTIDGSSPSALAAGGILRVVSDGSNWRTV